MRATSSHARIGRHHMSRMLLLSASMTLRPDMTRADRHYARHDHRRRAFSQLEANIESRRRFRAESRE